MKPHILLWLIFIPGLLTAQELPAFRFRGELLSNHRLLTKGRNEWAWNENKLSLTTGWHQNKVSVSSSLWIRHLHRKMPVSGSQLSNKAIINPWDMELREAYAHIRGFVFPAVDLKIGRQRIAWGTADQFNPTDNLNPYDLEDITDLGKRRGIEAANLNWYASEAFSLQAVYLPFFKPANMPSGRYEGMFTQDIRLPMGLPMRRYSDTLILPSNRIAETLGAAIRLKWHLWDTDLSVSYAYTRDGLPLPARATLFPTPDGFDLHAELIFPRQHIVGFDAAGSVGNVGVWAEGALFIPAGQVTLNTLVYLPPPFPSPLQVDSVVLENKPYLKAVAGCDYTFRNGLYVNLQYLHGFIHERGHGNQKDYLMVALEKSYFNNKLKIRPLAGGVAMNDWENPTEDYAVFYRPELFWKGIDNLELSIGAYIFDGKGDNLFARLNNENMVTIKAIVVF